MSEDGGWDDGYSAGYDEADRNAEKTISDLEDKIKDLESEVRRLTEIIEEAWNKL